MMIQKNNALLVREKNNLENRLLFYSEQKENVGSVRLRCIRPALWFNAKYVAGRDLNTDDISGRDIFVLVKSSLNTYNMLRKFGHVIWDVIDTQPPNELDYYITSTNYAGDFLKLKKYNVINHPSSLGSSTVDTLNNRKPYWIGNIMWKPLIRCSHCTINVSNYTEKDIDSFYRKAGILLNNREKRKGYNYHININSGIKLINSIRYGIPSLTGNEPWVDEIGAGCTLVTENNEIDEAVRILQNDDDVYNMLRMECIKNQDKYSDENIKKQYETFFNSL